jgi:hypothetical protein
VRVSEKIDKELFDAVLKASKPVKKKRGKGKKKKVNLNKNYLLLIEPNLNFTFNL